MKLTHTQIQELISGAVRFVDTENGLTPLRFNAAQLAWYDQFPSFKIRSQAAAGIKMDFTSDAGEIKISYASCTGSSRNWCFFDVYQDGILVRHCGTANRQEQPEGTILWKTGGGTHRITIYLPNIAGIIIQEMELADASFLKPEKRAKKLLVFGDSITQGYDAYHPSLCYAHRMADHFNLELVNKAIGGDTFAPEMGEIPEDFVPEHLFVAYGTNDWSTKTRENFEHDASGFFRNLRKRFPETPLHVLLPIWRGDLNRETQVGSFQDMRSFLLDCCKLYRNIQIIDGLTLFPRLEEFFSDQYLHPNDQGFLLMADGIIRELEKEIK